MRLATSAHSRPEQPSGRCPLLRGLRCKTRLVLISAPDFGFLRVSLGELSLLSDLLTLSTLDEAAMRGGPVPEAGHGREAWPVASGFAQLLSVALRL